MQLQTMRCDAIGCSLPADKELVELFEASSPIHADRNGLPRPIEKIGVSRLPPSYRHAVVSLGTILQRPVRAKRAFLFPIALSDSYLATSTEDDSASGNLDCLEQSKISVKRLRGSESLRGAIS